MLSPGAGAGRSRIRPVSQHAEFAAYAPPGAIDRRSARLRPVSPTARICPWDRRDRTGRGNDLEAQTRGDFQFQPRLACIWSRDRFLGALIACDAFEVLRDVLASKFLWITVDASAAGQDPSRCVIEASLIDVKTLRRQVSVSCRHRHSGHAGLGRELFGRSGRHGLACVRLIGRGPMK